MNSSPQAVWGGRGSTSLAPPPDYWSHLGRAMTDPQLKQLKEQSDGRANEFASDRLAPPEASAVELLDRVARDGWLEQIERRSCPNCDFSLSDEAAAQPECPDCHQPFSLHGGVVVERVYVRELAPTRDVNWVVAIHGMNTSGAWQEAFTWHLATTWGRSVPVAVYKYGIVIAGVLMAWRRRKLRNDLREKLATLQDEARTQGFLGKPDVIAHSFGTWLFGQLLRKELARAPHDRLTFGRTILTGCVLRPDFDWKKIKDAQLVDDVLNHYGTKDRVVPWAHATIFDSGPSGQRGFDGDQVVNVRAKDFHHSDLFSIEHFVVDGRSFQESRQPPDDMTYLAYAYYRYWRPFLMLPRAEFDQIPDRADPPKKWRQLPWLFRGTVFPFLALPLILSLLMFGLARLGLEMWATREIFKAVIKVSAAGLASSIVGIGLAALWRRWRG